MRNYPGRLRIAARLQGAGFCLLQEPLPFLTESPNSALGRFGRGLQRLRRFHWLTTKLVEPGEQRGLRLFGAGSEFVGTHRFLFQIRLFTLFRAPSEKTLDKHQVKPGHWRVVARTEEVPACLNPLCSILLVEDHYDTQQAFAALLRSWGHEVATSDSAATALKALDERPVDVVVSDIGLPDGNGYDLVTEARQRRPGLATIAVSAFFTAADQDRGSDAGFDMFFAKPVDLATLRRVLERIPSPAERNGTEPDEKRAVA